MGVNNYRLLLSSLPSIIKSMETHTVKLSVHSLELLAFDADHHLATRPIDTVPNMVGAADKPSQRGGQPPKTHNLWARGLFLRSNLIVDI